MTNREAFVEELTKQYADLFANDPEYAYAAARHTPSTLATKMADGLVSGSADKGGLGIQRTCRSLGINHTYKAIREFLG